MSGEKPFPYSKTPTLGGGVWWKGSQFSVFLFLRALVSIKRIPPKVPSYLPNTVALVVKNFNIRSLRAVWQRYSDHCIDIAIKNVMSLF